MKPLSVDFEFYTLYYLRERTHAMVYRHWKDPEDSLISGILLGIERGIPVPVQKAFRDTGTSHIIAISGRMTCNISIGF